MTRKILLSLLTAVCAFGVLGIGYAFAEDLPVDDSSATNPIIKELGKRANWMKAHFGKNNGSIGNSGERPQLTEEERQARQQKNLEQRAKQLGVATDELKARLESRRLEMLAQKAEILGLSADELKAKLDSGMRFHEIAEEQGIAPEQMQAKMREQARQMLNNRLNQAVENGTMTQEQAQKRFQRFDDKDAQSKNRKMPGMQGFFRGLINKDPLPNN